MNQQNRRPSRGNQILSRATTLVLILAACVIGLKVLTRESFHAWYILVVTGFVLPGCMLYVYCRRPYHTEGKPPHRHDY
jgi:hypothetical protein